MKLRDILNEINSFYIRDTLVRKDVFDTLDKAVQNQILKLKQEFDNLGYLDARTQLGPNQIARQSIKQKKDLSDKALKAFKIENEIKNLLKSEQEKEAELSDIEKNKLNSRKTQLLRQIKDLETIFPKKLSSGRDNPHKKSYELAKQELDSINKKLGELK